MDVRMINSVGDYVAGETYDLPDEVADGFILKGYAEGQLSREYSQEEIAAALDLHQAVSIGG